LKLGYPFLEIVQINYHVVLDATSNELWKEVDVLIVGAKGIKTETGC